MSQAAAAVAAALARRALLSVADNSDAVENHTSENKDNPGSEVKHPEYLTFILVPVFFIMGLLGFLICHLLKKKGYRCTTETESRQQEKIEMNESLAEGNNDTVGQIVNYIMKNEANADVLKAMVADNSVVGDKSMFDLESPATPNTPASPTSPGSPTSPDSPSSPGATPSKHTCRGQHFHTVGGVVERNACNRCSHKKWHLMKSSPKVKEPKRNRASVTVLAVGRFKVTKVENKSKEQKRLMSDSGDGTTRQVPSTPVKAGARSRSGTDSEV